MNESFTLKHVFKLEVSASACVREFKKAHDETVPNDRASLIQVNCGQFGWAVNVDKERHSDGDANQDLFDFSTAHSDIDFA